MRCGLWGMVLLLLGCTSTGDRAMTEVEGGPAPELELDPPVASPVPWDSPCPTEGLLSESRFGALADEWTEVAGAFARHDGLLRITERTEGATAWLGPRAWEDYSVEARLRLDHPNGDAGLGFRVTEVSDVNDGGAHYYVGLYPATDELQLGVIADGRWRPIAAAPTDVDAGTWYTLRVELSGDRIRIRLDGTTVIEIVDGTFGRGSVSIRSYRTLASYDYLVVCAPY